MWRPITNSHLLQQCNQRRYTLITVVSLAVILLAFFIAFAAFSDDPPALPTLKLVHVVFRHGDRTPTSSYPTDPYKDHEWLGGRGALTNEGKRRMYSVGEVIRYRYNKFLGELFNPDEVYVESSYAPRCQESAQVFLAGLFPPKGLQVWNKELKWQPIPVNPIPRALDNKIAAKKKCLAFDIAKRKSDEEINRKLSAKDRELFDILTQHTGMTISNISQVESLFYTLKTEAENDLKLPDWVDDSFYPYRMQNMAGLNLASYTYNEELKKFQAGPMLKEWVFGMKERSHIPKKKAHFYSAHDLTIVSLARALGFHELELPFYGDCLIVEYHESDDAVGKGFVQVWYFRNSERPKFDQLTAPFCETNCPLEEFSTYLNKYINWEDWDAECKNRN